MHFRERNPPLPPGGGGGVPFTFHINDINFFFLEIVILKFWFWQTSGEGVSTLIHFLDPCKTFKITEHMVIIYSLQIIPEQVLHVLLSGDRQHAFNIRYLLYLSYILCIIFTIITLFMIFNCLYDLFCYYFIPFVCFLLSFSVF